MNKKILIIIVILLVAAGGYFIYRANQGSNGAINYPTTINKTSTIPNTSNPASANNQQNPPINQEENLNVAVSIKNFAFNPKTLTVKAGTVVAWTNNDSAPHQIKSSNFNSAVLNNGQNFKFTFSAAGEYNYLCSIHPSMTGKIIVTK